MRPEELEKTRKLIQTSLILSSVERAEWLQLLREMNDKQIMELNRILNPAGTAPVNLPISRQVNIAQKEITTSIPFYEPEIAAPRPVPLQPSQQAKQAAQPQRTQQSEPAPAPADPAELQRRVANIVREMDQRKQGARADTLPPPVPQVTARPQPSLSTPIPQQELASRVEKPEMDEEPAPPAKPKLILHTAADFSKLTPEFLSDKSLNAAYDQLMQAITEISNKEPIYEIIRHFESSPLQAAYVRLGAELLNDADPNRLLAYENAQRNLEQQGISSLNKQQFEFLTDFRRQLQQLY